MYIDASKSRRSLRPAFSIIIAIVLYVSLVYSAHAFKIFRPAIHQEITLASLNATILANSINADATSWGFTSVAKAQIISGNVSTDLLTRAGTKPDTEVWHFDNSEITAGADLVLLVRAEVIRLIAEADRGYRSANKLLGDKRSKDARFLLGTVLHTIQDFYSHSSWVETGRDGIAGMAWYGDRRTNPFVGEGTGSCVCGSPIALSDNGLTSAYFFSGGLLTGYAWDNEKAVEAIIEGKCVHSETNDEAREAMNCGDSIGNPFNYQLYPILPGTDKDKPGRPWPKRQSESNSLHDIARDKAVLASAAFTQSILLEAKEAGLYQGICGFLGYSTTTACNFFYGPFEYEKELNFFNNGGTYLTDEAFTFDVRLFDSTLGSLDAIKAEWTVEFSGSGSCPDDPSQIIPAANQCQFLQAFRNFTIVSEDPGYEYQWLYCDTGFDERGRFDACGLQGLLNPGGGIFGYLEWPGGDKSFQKTYTRPSRALLSGFNRCVLCTDGTGVSTFQLNGSFISRLTGFLGIDNGPGQEPSSYSNTQQYFDFSGTFTVRLRLTYEYSAIPGQPNQSLAKLGGDDE